MTDLAVRIEQGYPELSPQEQRAADFMRDHLADLAVYNATEVASLSGVSKATVSRLYRRLGFDSAEQLRDHVRGLRGAPRVVEATDFDEHLQREITNLRTALGGLSLDEPARLIATARRVLVVGFRNSYPVAMHLRQQLAQARDAVELAPLPGQSIAEELASLGAEDAVVLVGFRRRPASFAGLVAALDGIPSILITDPSGRPYARQVGHLIECPIDSVSAFDSYAAAASVVSLLASAVLGLRSRVAEVNARFDGLDELEGA
jgi:DNA-binding MurR/RpiR family transcriptional regulator